MVQSGKCIVRMNSEYGKVCELRHIIRFCNMFDCDYVPLSDLDDGIFEIYKAGKDMPTLGYFVYCEPLD